MSARTDATPTLLTADVMLDRVVDMVRGQSPALQVVAIWLLEQADDELLVDDIDWETLASYTGIAETTLRRVHLKDSAILTTQGGFIEREERLIGGSVSKPIFRFYL